MPEYATVDQLRAEGVSGDLTDAQLLRVIQRNSAAIERYTRRWFYPKECTYRLDGTGHDMLLVGSPIIAIREVRVLAPDYLVLTALDQVVDLASIRVYNRHLSEDLRIPDDRNAPKIQYLTSWAGNRRAPNVHPAGWFPKGQQNIQVTGLFGYTDWDGGATLWTDGITPVGKTPELITQACMLLCVRDTLPLADLEGRVAQALAARITQERTRDQSISYGTSARATVGTTSGISNNPEIQALLAPFVASATLGAV